MFLVDELQNPAKYGLASMLRASATIRFARGGDNSTVVPEELAVAAAERAEANIAVPEKQMTLSVDLIAGSNRLVTTIMDAAPATVRFYIPAWWSEDEVDAAGARSANYL